MDKIKIGDLFEINTPRGSAYLHYVHHDETTGELIRVLNGLYTERPVELDKLLAEAERYIVSFPLKAAKKQNIIELVGNFSTFTFVKPKVMRTKHILRGEFLGWHLVDTESWERTLVKSLSAEQKKLSPWGIWSASLLIENLVNDWSLEKWN